MKDIEKMLYMDLGYPSVDDFIKKIEAALGFKLFFWQKTYIFMGKFRHAGMTTAEILRELLALNKGPIDFTKKPMSPMEAIYRKELERIKSKLTAAGIETRPVVYIKKDMNEFIRPMRSNDSMDGFRANVCIVDEMHEYRQPMKPLKREGEENEKTWK